MKNPFRIGRKFDDFFADWLMTKDRRHLSSPDKKYVLELRWSDGWSDGWKSPVNVRDVEWNNGPKTEPLIEGVHGWTRIQVVHAARRRMRALMKAEDPNTRLLQITGNAGKQSVVEWLLKK